VGGKEPPGFSILLGALIPTSYQHLYTCLLISLQPSPVPVLPPLSYTHTHTHFHMNTHTMTYLRISNIILPHYISNFDIHVLIPLVKVFTLCQAIKEHSTYGSVPIITQSDALSFVSNVLHSKAFLSQDRWRSMNRLHGGRRLGLMGETKGAFTP